MSSLRPVWGRRPRARNRLFCAAAAAVLLGTGALAAAPDAPPCSRGEHSALSELACEIARGLGVNAEALSLASAELESDVQLALPAQARSRLLAVIGGRLRASSISPEPTPLGAALAREVGKKKLVYLSPQIVRGELRVTADVYAPTRGFWERVKRMILPPEAHVFASRRLDAELHTFLPPVPLVAGNVLRSHSPEQRPVSLACGDLDGDGALELALVGRQRVALGRIRGKRVVVHASAEWSLLSPVAPSPLREPVAAAALSPGRHLDVGSSDRSDAIRLSPVLVPLQRLGAKLPWPGGGCAVRNALGVEGQPAPCLAGEARPKANRLVDAADALAGAIVIRKDGSARVVRAARQAEGGGVTLSDESGKSARLEQAGAQLALGDLDFDGQPELVTTLDTLDPSRDAVVVHTWLDAGNLVERWRLGVPSGVSALAICPAEDGGRAALLVATTGGIWLIR